MNTPIIALIGQPNVGKSSLFNCLVGKKSAIVSAKAGVTRDRQFSRLTIQDHHCWLVDTAGLAGEHDKLSQAMYLQSRQAASQADLILFMVDGSKLVSDIDIQLARFIQKTKKPIILVLNKSDIANTDHQESYQRLGIKENVIVSCGSKQGLDDLKALVTQNIPKVTDQILSDKPIISIVGKPNAGKSTLSNHYAKEDRCIVSNIPGTTRDAISIELEHKGLGYTLIDTAGMRKKARIHEEVEQYATANTLKAIDQAHTVIHLIDATEPIARQDFRIIHLCLDMGKSVVIAINKIDCLSQEARDFYKKDVNIALTHLGQVPILEISATQGRHTQKLMKLSLDMAQSMQREFSTSQLTKILERAVSKTAPPTRLGRPINLRLAHVSRKHPLEITIRGKRTSYLPKSYVRYLTKSFTQQLNIIGRQIKLKLESDHNPYVDK